jgi:N-acetylglucosaminyl-diphospho-decaprenol L-rhamnosyltransferase
VRAVLAGGRSRLSVYLGERNKVLTTRDRFPARLPIAALGSLAAHTRRFAKRGAWAQLGYGFAGWWAGLRGERGVPKWMQR